jgi:23S rRNA pseudouridine1911/1915/1917 synthase
MLRAILGDMMTENTPSTHEITIEDEAEAGLRLDKVLATRIPDLSRTRIQALLEEGRIVRGDGTILSSASQKVRLGEHYAIAVPPPIESEIRAVEMPLDIIFEDDDILIINKPAGLTVHPAPGHYDDTLVNALLAHCQDSLSGIGGVARPGIVHRIDKDTSGLLVVAKHDKAHAHLARQLKNRTLKRTYLAICWGLPPYGEGTMEADIGRNPRDRKKMAVVKNGGKPATTHYKVLESFSLNKPVVGRKDTLQRVDLASLVECELETGRTHQIRVHFLHHHFPLLGDPVYGSDTSFRLRGSLGKALPPETLEILLGFTRQALHATQLELVHPISKKEMQFEAPLPDDFFMVLDSLRNLQI